MNDAQEVAPVTIRPGRAADEAFVMASWLRTFKHRSPFAFRLREAEFYPYHHPIATDILARATLSVAVLEEDPNVIIGYLITEATHNGRLLHFAYTKKEFRQMRVFTQLLEESGLPGSLEGVEVTHPTFDWFNILSPKYPGAQANPYRWCSNAP